MADAGSGPGGTTYAAAAGTADAGRATAVAGPAGTADTLQVLVVQLGEARFALPLRELARVVPAATLTPVPGAPAAVAGLLDLHGQAIPVLDLGCLAGVPPGPVWADSRILLLALPNPDHAQQPLARQLVGLLAEHVLGIARLDTAAVAASGVTSAPFVGQVVTTPDGLIQLIEPVGLLTPELRAALTWPEPS